MVTPAFSYNFKNKNLSLAQTLVLLYNLGSMYVTN